MKKRKRLYPSITVGILTFLLVFLALSYFPVENLTRKYGDEFREKYIENGFYSGIEYLKVIKYRAEEANIYGLGEEVNEDLNRLTDNHAVVLYVEENHSSASLFIFKYDDEWKFESWHTIWSYSGSADGFMWPYYP